MSYPQSPASAAVINLEDIYRLNTPLVSDGDIYEAAVGASTFAIGPDSDVSKVTIAYFDGLNTPTYMSQVSVGPGVTFPARLFATNQQYMPSKRPGRLLFWPEERYNPDASALFSSPTRVDTIPPILDLIQYLSPPSGDVSGKRKDKRYYFQQLPQDNSSGEYLLIVPYYGRKYATIKLWNCPGNLTVHGLTYAQASGALDTLIELSDDSSPLPTGFQRIYTAGRHGMHDALVLEFSGADLTAQPTPLTIIVSDDESAFVAPPEP